MARQPLDLNALPRPEPQRYQQCAEHGCNREPRTFSRFCTLHSRNFYRTRDPNGRAIRIREIRPYLTLAEEYLGRNVAHPAVVAAEELLRANLVDATLPREVRKQLQRLRVDGATPREMLIIFLGVWGLSFYHPYAVTTDACRDFNVGNRVLRATPMPSAAAASGKRHPIRLPARVAEVYGQFLRERLGIFAEQFWRHVQNELEATERAARAVVDALQEMPFGITRREP